MDLTVKDVAVMLNISETTVRKWLITGKLPAYRIHHQYRFSRIEIENWMTSCRLNAKYAADSKANTNGQNEKKVAKKKRGIYRFNLYRAVYNGLVLNSISSQTKEQAIQKTLEIVAQHLALDPSIITELFLDRENLMSTALGNGVAVPHTRDFLSKRMQDAVIVAFLNTAIHWGALDQQPVHTLFFLFSRNSKNHLHLLAKLAYLSSQKEALQFMRTKPQKGELLAFLKNWECSIN